MVRDGEGWGRSMGAGGRWEGPVRGIAGGGVPRKVRVCRTEKAGRLVHTAAAGLRSRGKRGGVIRELLGGNQDYEIKNTRGMRHIRHRGASQRGTGMARIQEIPFIKEGRCCGVRL